MGTDLFFKVLYKGLSLWESKEQRKYIDRYIKLKRKYYEEFNKERQDHRALDGILFELELLGSAFVNSPTGKETKD